MELAVDVAASRHQGCARRWPFPAGLRPLLRQKRLTAAQLGRARAGRRGRCRRSAPTSPTSPRADLVDEVGLLWLRRPAGWQQRLDELVVGTEAPDATSAARREQRRRAAAQEAAERERAEHAVTRERWVREHERRVGLQARLAEAERERDDAIGSASQARADADRLLAELATARADVTVARHEATAALERAVEAESARDEVLAARAGEPLALPDARSRRSTSWTSAGRRPPRSRRSTGRRRRPARRRGRSPTPRRAGGGRPPPGAAVPRRRGEGPRRTPVQIPGGLYARLGGGHRAPAARCRASSCSSTATTSPSSAGRRWPLDVQRERLVDDGRGRRPALGHAT